ncbi:quinone oxidoreductase family protein [Streptosporangium subroseum]|uniref:quinone oxidoreductase family protein n=1 Tax=Streptosporangium subroseum TaxID=106412 RepID=UPI003090AC2E|nr:zinc-binding alcohol dehydrogenase family protein [Streptosporangium subroseum]
MRALRFTRFGPPDDVLEVAEVTDPDIGGGDCLVAVKAASVNPSDLKNVAGAMEGTVLPRIPGRDFAGVVLEGPRDRIGAEVWGTGGDVGFTRDGSHAELIAVPGAALVRKPERLSFAEASVLGVTFVVGWLGAVETALLDKGETIAVFGVSGGVGGAVAQIARVRGARVIGVDRVAPAEDTPAAWAIEHFVPLTGDAGDIGSAVRRLTGGIGADVVYDAVGGVTTPAALSSLAPRGRLVVISAVGTRTVKIDLVDFYHREARMLGSDSRKLDCVQSAERLSQLAPYFEAGDFHPLPIARSFTLEQGRNAYSAVAGHLPGRVVICP